MDFHSLARKELQALCKQNKIPANMSNAAMADALKALDKVEGLDELINAPKLEPMQSTPRTVCRTSNRRRPIVAEAESSQPLTRTRRSTRRTTAEEADQESKHEPESLQILTRTRRVTRKTSSEERDQENAIENPLETPIPQARRGTALASKNAESKVIGCVEENMVDSEKMDFPETPAIQGSRRRGLMVSTRKKTETLKEDKSVQRVYSTRRSVRLLEKSIEGLSLEEIRESEVKKADGCCKESDGKNVGSGTDMLMVSEDHCNSVGIQKVIQSLDNGRDLQPEIHEDDKTDEIDDLEGKQETCSGDCETMEEKVEIKQLVEGEMSIHFEVDDYKASQEDDKSGGYEVDNLKAKLEVGPKECCNLDNVLGPESNGSEVLAGENFLQPLDEQVEKKHQSEEDNAIMSEVDDCNALQEVGDSNCYEADDLKAKLEAEYLDKCFELASNCHEVLEKAGIKIPEILAAENCPQPLDEQVKEEHHTEKEKAITSEVDNCNTVQDVGDSDCHEADDLKAKVETESLACKNLDKLLELRFNFFEVLEEAGIKHQLEEDMAIESKVDECNVVGTNLKKFNLTGIVPEIIAGDDKHAFSQELEVIQAELVDDNGPEVFYADISDVEEDIDGNIGDFQSKYPAQEELNANLQCQAPKDDDPEKVEEHSESTGEAESPKRCNEVLDDVESESFATIELLDLPSLENVEELSIEYNSEALVDISIIEDNFEVLHKETPKSVKQATPFCSSVSDGQVSAGTLFDVPVRQAEDCEDALNPSSLDKTPAGGKVNGVISKSPFPADTLQGQLPRPTESATKKSSVKDRITLAKMADPSDNNKENVEIKMKEPKGEKMNNEVNLDALSLRQLTKELKEKLQLANKKKSKEQDGTKVEEKRFALQKLPEN